MQLHGSPSPKRTLLWSNMFEIAELDLGKLSRAERERRTTTKTVKKYINKRGEKAIVGTADLAKSQKLVQNKKKIWKTKGIPTGIWKQLAPRLRDAQGRRPPSGPALQTPVQPAAECCRAVPLSTAGGRLGRSWSAGVCGLPHDFKQIEARFPTRLIGSLLTGSRWSGSHL